MSEREIVGTIQFSTLPSSVCVCGEESPSSGDGGGDDLRKRLADLTSRVEALEKWRNGFDHPSGPMIAWGRKAAMETVLEDFDRRRNAWLSTRAELVERVRQARGKYRCGIDGFPVGGTLGDWARLVRAIDALLAHEDQEARGG